MLSGSSSPTLIKIISASFTSTTDISLPVQWWWWERLLVGAWMLTTLVLAKSYAGNLMSLLAVRYVPQPFQTLRDVLEDKHAIMIWMKHSNAEQYIKVS